MSEYSITIPGFERPLKFEWVFQQLKPVWYENIPSTSTQKIALKLTKILSDAQITFTITPVDASGYSNWLEYFIQKMTEQGHQIFATPEWYSQKIAEGRQIFLLELLQHGQRVGTAVFSRWAQPALTYTQHFKVNERVSFSNVKNASLGIILDLLFVQTAVDGQASNISGGLTRNGFGFYNTLGYLAAKLKMGFVPTLRPEIACEATFPSHHDEPCIWFAKKTDSDLLEIILKDKAQIPSEILQSLSSLSYPQHLLEELLATG